MDTGTEALSVLDEIRGYDTLGDLSSSEYFNAIGLAARPDVGRVGDLRSLDERLQTMHGREAIGAAGLGLQLHILRHLLVTSLDLEGCLQVADATEHLLVTSPSMAEVCRSVAWQKEHGRVTALLSASTFAMGSMNDGSDLEAVKHCMDLVIMSRDGVIRHSLATLTATSESHYIKLIHRKAGELIKKVAVQYPQLRLDENLPAALRHAAAHVDYDVDERGVITHPGGREVVLNHEDFFDQILAYLEESVALMLGVTAALATEDMDITVKAHVAERDRIACIYLMLGILGVSNTNLTTDQSTFRIQGDGLTDGFMTIVAAITDLVSNDIDLVTAGLCSGDAVGCLCEADLEAYRAFTPLPSLWLLRRHS